jgi:histone deacetylase complex subunit SAP18
MCAAYQSFSFISPICLYFRKDASLRELTDLIKNVNMGARRRNARLSFSFVYPDKRGKNVMKEIGVVTDRRSDDEAKTLADLRFETGDYLDVAILTN